MSRTNMFVRGCCGFTVTRFQVRGLGHGCRSIPYSARFSPLTNTTKHCITLSNHMISTATTARPYKPGPVRWELINQLFYFYIYHLKHLRSANTDLAIAWATPHALSINFHTLPHLLMQLVSTCVLSVADSEYITHDLFYSINFHTLHPVLLPLMPPRGLHTNNLDYMIYTCLLYTSDAADE